MSRPPLGLDRRARALQREKVIGWGILLIAAVIAALAVTDAWKQTGTPSPGFGVMENLLVGVGGLERGGLQPFDLVRALDGRLLGSGRDVQDAVRARPPGTTFHYILNRGSRLVEADVPSVVRTVRDFERYLIEGLLASSLFLALGAVVLWLKPGALQTRLFLAFCLTWFCVSGLYLDAHTTYRWTALFLTAVAVCPAVTIHLALTFPERLRIARRHPRIVWLPYLISAAIVPMLVGWVPPPSPDSLLLIPAVTTAYWGLALVLLIAALARTSWRGSTPPMRQRARVLMLAFAVGQLVPVAGTAVEAIARVPVPHLNVLWRLNILFPLAVAYAMVRYDLFDLRAVLRTGTIYGVVTGLVALAYAGAITLLDVSFAALGVRAWPFVSPVILALAVVLLLNPIYARTQSLVDRMFFRERIDVERSLIRLSDVMTTLLDLDRIVELADGTAREFFHPVRQRLFLQDAERGGYRLVAGDAEGAVPEVPADSPLVQALGVARQPVTRERLAEAPELEPYRAEALALLDAVGAALAVPFMFRDRITGFLALGDKRSGAAYTTFDLRVLRMVANQSAVALENASAYRALQQANLELRDALRRVEILESIRASLSKFVPTTVKRLIEEAPDSPELDKRDVDVSVLFVDIAGYTRLAERLDARRVNQLVEVYFSAFLDEIMRRGGDVNETAGDGLMVIFRDEDPHRHARAAVLTALAILERANQISRETEGVIGPVAIHAGVNSGVAAVGATKIEGKAGTRWTYTASGSVTNLAARLAALGTGDGVFIGPETRERLYGEFPVDDLGLHRLRNVEDPVRVFRLSPLCVADLPPAG